MSRIGKKPITIPAGVTVSVDELNNVVVKGPKGEQTQNVNKVIKVSVLDGSVTFEALNDSTQANSMHGLYRTLVENMIIGVTQGFSKNLTINGVGYKAVQKGEDIELNLGFSHPVIVKPMQNIKLSCPSPLEIKVEGINKEQVGQMAANIRAIRPVEPYHAYGIRYSDEVVVKKEGKKAGK